MIIAVDFDGTIVEHEYPEIGAANVGAIEWMKKWSDAGASIMLWTMRSGRELADAVEYLRQRGIELFGVNENPEQHAWTSSNKQYANLYVDDAAAGCPMITRQGASRPMVDWAMIGPLVMRQIEEQQ